MREEQQADHKWNPEQAGSKGRRPRSKYHDQRISCKDQERSFKWSVKEICKSLWIIMLSTDRSICEHRFKTRGRYSMAYTLGHATWCSEIELSISRVDGGYIIRQQGGISKTGEIREGSWKIDGQQATGQGSREHVESHVCLERIC